MTTNPYATTAEQCAATWLPLREVVILVSNVDLQEFGTLRADNVNLLHWALVWQYAHTIESTSDSDSVVLQLIRKSLKRYPVAVEFMRLAQDLQVKLFQ